MPRFDWKDSLLIALGFVACVALATFIERAFGIEIEKEILQVLVGVTILGFPALRRRFFGEGHRLSGLNPQLLGARNPKYAGRGRVRRPALEEKVS